MLTSNNSPNLVLDEELDSLDGGGSGLRYTSSHAREHKVLSKSKFLVGHRE